MNGTFEKPNSNNDDIKTISELNSGMSNYSDETKMKKQNKLQYDTNKYYADK